MDLHSHNSPRFSDSENSGAFSVVNSNRDCTPSQGYSEQSDSKYFSKEKFFFSSAHVNSTSSQNCGTQNDFDPPGSSTLTSYLSPRDSTVDTVTVDPTLSDSQTEERSRNFRSCRLRNRYSSLKLTQYEGFSSSSDLYYNDETSIAVSESTSGSEDLDSSDDRRQKRSRRDKSTDKKKRTITVQRSRHVSINNHGSYETSFTTPLDATRRRQSHQNYKSSSTTPWDISDDCFSNVRKTHSSVQWGERKFTKRSDSVSSNEGTLKGWRRSRKRERSVNAMHSPSPARKRTLARRAASQHPDYSYLLDEFSAYDSCSFDSPSCSTNAAGNSSVPAVERALGYRFIGAPENTEPSAIPSSRWGDKEPPAIHDLEFFVKWINMSHLHNSWCTYKYLLDNGIGGQRRVENFFRKLNSIYEERQHMTVDEIEQQNISLEFQRQVDLDFLVAQRVVAYQLMDRASLPVLNKISEQGASSYYKLNTDLLETKAENCCDSSISPVHCEVEPTTSVQGAPSLNCITQESQMSGFTEMYFVKWTNAQYDQCTWETSELLEQHGFKPLIEEFKARGSYISGSESAFHPLHSHSLCRTSFEPYTKTPFYLQTAEAGALRDYQLTGLNWMVSRMKKGFSVLLADEMGLGKTVQTIAVVGHMMFSELLVGPFLVVVPQSTADNWLSEFKLWLPLANVIVYHGNPQSRELIRKYEMFQVTARPYVPTSLTQDDRRVGLRITPGFKRQRWSFDVCICTFSILNNPEESDFLRSIDWYFMAIDEAHLLKNRKSRRFRELNHFKAQYRILLSGTPLHNNLEELWSLLHFLCPRLYENFDAFQTRFSEIERPDSVGALKETQLASLQCELNKLVLRRVKKDVEKSLPRKIERILRVELSPQQSHCCKAIIARNYQALARSTGTSKTSLQNICMDLKKVCNHPLLLQSDFDIATLQSRASLSPAHRDEWHHTLLNTSGKLALLDKLLAYLKERQHRVLIFSQMVRMLNILSIYLVLRGYKHQRLDGTMTRETRKKAIDHFNNLESDDFCFLLSTRAGGLGINLTSADTVIIYDSDWNPQNDLQAEARAHRIGQTKAVQIYRLVTKDTIEERILERAKTKMVLDTLVVQGLNKKMESSTMKNSQLFNTDISLESSQKLTFSKEELTRILKFGASNLWKSTPLLKCSQDTTTETSREGNAIPLSTSATKLEIDLERVLAEAEENTSESFADQLLSSFTNISDFSYKTSYDEMPNAKDEDDATFWEKTIPLSERQAHNPSTCLLFTKRIRKRVQRRGVVSSDFLDDEYHDESVQSLLDKTARTLKNSTATPSSPRSTNRNSKRKTHSHTRTLQKLSEKEESVKPKNTGANETPSNKPTKGASVSSQSAETNKFKPAKKRTMSNKPLKQEKRTTKQSTTRSTMKSRSSGLAPQSRVDASSPSTYKENSNQNQTSPEDISLSGRSERDLRSSRISTRRSHTTNKNIQKQNSASPSQLIPNAQILNSNRIPRRSALIPKK